MELWDHQMGGMGQNLQNSCRITVWGGWVGTYRTVGSQHGGDGLEPTELWDHQMGGMRGSVGGEGGKRGGK